MENTTKTVDGKFEDTLDRHIERLENSPPQPKYIPQKNIVDQIERSFVFHPPKEDQRDRYIMIREAARKLAKQIATNTPPCREQSLSLTHLEETVMWANAAIARNE